MYIGKLHRIGVLFLLAGTMTACERNAPRSPAEDPQATGPTRTIAFETDEATRMDVDISPDGRTLLFGVLGDLYTAPVGGGTARQLIGGDLAYKSGARYSDDGKQIAFLSDRSGGVALWAANADGTHLRQLTQHALHRSLGPDSGRVQWTQDGHAIVTVGSTILSRDGRVEYAIVEDTMGRRPTALRRIGLADHDTSSVREGRVHLPKVSPDGQYVAYVVDTTGNRQRLCVQPTAGGAERCLAEPIGEGESWITGYSGELPDYSFAPDGRSVWLSLRGKLARVDVPAMVVHVVPVRIPVRKLVVEQNHVVKRIAEDSLTVKGLQWATVTPDQRRVVFSALGHLYSSDLATGQTGRLTQSTALEADPAISPDGRWVAYVAWTDSAGAQVLVRSLSGDSTWTVTPSRGQYTSPAWSPDSRLVAYAAFPATRPPPNPQPEVDKSPPFPELSYDVRWVKREGGSAVTVASGATNARPDPVLAFAMLDGHLRLFYTAHVRPFEGRGFPHGDDLFSIGLDGRDRRSHLHVDDKTDEAVPSPDGRHLAIGHTGSGVWVMALPTGTAPAPDTLAETGRWGAVPETLAVNRRRSAVETLTTAGAYDIAWRGDSTLTWLFTNELSMGRLGASGHEAPRQTAITLRVPRPVPHDVLAFRNARLITLRGGSDEVIEHGTIVVENNRVVAIGPESAVQAPPEATVVDATGQTIIPGLIGVHDHHVVYTRDAFQQERWGNASSLAWGVTTIFDPSASTLDVVADRERVETGEEIGPRIFSTGVALVGFDSTWAGQVRFENLVEARRVVAWHKAFGVEFLKEWILDYRDEREWLAQAAREAGMMVTAEGIDVAMNMERLSDGYLFEHCIATTLYSDVLDFMVQTHAYYTPTLAGVESCTMAGSPSAADDIRSRGGEVGQVIRQTAAKRARFARSLFWIPGGPLSDSIPTAQRWWLDVARSAAALAHRGGAVCISSHGPDSILDQWEMWAFAMGGMTNQEVLRAATWNGANKLGYEQDLGSLEVGKLADFVVLDGNPLEDIYKTAAIRYTVKNGVVYDGATLDEVYPSTRPFAALWFQAPHSDAKR